MAQELLKESITLVVAVEKRGDVLSDNLLSSPLLEQFADCQILIQENFASAALAYNDAIDRSANDLIIFAHQDVIFPASWLVDLEAALDHLQVVDPAWGVLGCYGETRDCRGQGYIYAPGRGILGRRFAFPAPVQTLDEIVLILRKSSGLRFDRTLPHFHLYGTDICLRAAEMGMISYAISAFCVHNANQYCLLPKQFYDACRHIRGTWKNRLPIQTTCIRLTRFGLPLYSRRVREAYVRCVPSKAAVRSRATNVRQLLVQAHAASASDE